MPLEPILPSFDGLRLATLEDLPRIATVAAAGFFHSPTFQFQRRRYAEYPDDTLFSYWEDYRTSILDPECVVLVAVDALVDVEESQVYSALKQAAAYMPGAGPLGLEVVVGVASVRKLGAVLMFPARHVCYSMSCETRTRVSTQASRADLCAVCRST
jgi:hypothetical protein